MNNNYPSCSDGSNAPRPAIFDRFPSVIILPVVWGDMDAFQHVNNTVPIGWFESGRVDLLEQMGLHEMMKRERIGPILAAVECHFRRQLHYPDTVLIGSRVAKLGRTSATIQHVVYSTSQQHATTDGTSIIVMFDYHLQRPVRIPETFRQAVLEIQQADPPQEVPRVTLDEPTEQSKGTEHE